MSTLAGSAASPANGFAPFAEAIRAQIGENIHRCWQCVKCTSGCPLAEQFDLAPNQVMRALQLNDASVLESRAIWLCASCHTCATRCPRDIDVTSVMDALRIEARRRGVRPAIPEIHAFNSIFMRLAGFFGRVPEALLMGVFNLARGKLFRDAGLGWQLLRRGRLKLVPAFVHPGRSPTPVANGANKVGYFPGCASEGSAFEYDRTARAAALVATMCPMCHMNLDARQPRLALESDIPVLHATQLMVLAFGAGERAALLGTAIIDPRPVLKTKRLLD